MGKRAKWRTYEIPGKGRSNLVTIKGDGAVMMREFGNWKWVKVTDPNEQLELYAIIAERGKQVWPE